MQCYVICQGAVFEGTFCEITNYAGYQAVRMGCVILDFLLYKSSKGIRWLPSL